MLEQVVGESQVPKAKRVEGDIGIDRIHLYGENPRHKPLETQAQIIAQLCNHEQVLQLARDIATNGLNPLERFALMLDENSSGSKGSAYIVAEGNRRMCALKLLNDPDLAPPDKRKDFEKVSTGWNVLETVPATVFEDLEDLDLWLDRTHQGEQGGIGRKNWNAEQKQRHSGDSKNRAAQVLLDYAEQEGFITAEERRRKLTTVQRFVGNPLVREALGLVTNNPQTIERNRSEADFKLLVKKFVSDLISTESKIHSRANRDDINAYARELSNIQGQTRESVEAQPLRAEPEKTVRSPRASKPKPHKHAKVIPHDKDLQDSLNRLKNRKLLSLYTSICSVSLPDNVPLVAVGAWSFLETLTACMGREERNSFESYLSKDRLDKLGFPKGAQSTTLRDVVGRIAAFGNTTKHHETAALFNGDQLANDMETINKLIIACVEEARKIAKSEGLAEPA